MAWGCKHKAVIPDSLRNVRPSFWTAPDGRMHFGGLCDYCKKDVWRHMYPDEDPPWKLSSVPCGCPERPHN